jgi:hypothetical protein
MHCKKYKQCWSNEDNSTTKSHVSRDNLRSPNKDNMDRTDEQIITQSSQASETLYVLHTEWRGANRYED